MFGKKVLSLVTLLFLGSQISKVFAEAPASNTPGYYYNDSEYWSVDHSGTKQEFNPNTSVDDENDCEDDIGKLIKTGGKVYLCLTSNVSLELKTTGSGKNYLMDKVADNIFTDDDTEGNVSIVVKDGDNAITFDDEYTNTEYCVYASNAIQGRVENFCSGTILENLYSCKNGLCSKKDSPIGAGNYIVQNEEGTAYNLYKCEEDIDKDKQGLGTVTCSIDETSNLYAVEKITNEKEYTFLKTIDDLAPDATITDLTTVSVYDCVEGECKATDALIKYHTTAPTIAYCHSSDGTACTTGTDTITLANIGTVSYSSNFIMTLADTSVVNIATGGNYFFPASTGNTFAVIRNNGNAIVGLGQIVPNTVYVKESDHTMVTSKDKTTCDNEITDYTISSSTATKGTTCTPTTPCELDGSTASNNVHCVAGYYIKGRNTLYECEDVVGESYKNCHVAASNGVGYYKNAETVESAPQYIKCATKDTAASCSGVTVNQNSCSSAGIGNLIVDNNDPANPVYSICIDGTSNSVVLSNSNADKKYFISINESGKTNPEGTAVFGTQVEDGYVLLNMGVNVLKNDSDALSYRYTNSDQKVLKRSDDNSVICENTENISEFVLDDENGKTYKKTTSSA